NELLMRSSLLITDYSSVAWDFYYLKKPVAFFQFDYATYEELQGSYIDLKKDLFGEKFTDADTLIKAIKAYIAKDFKLDVTFNKTSRIRYLTFMVIKSVDQCSQHFFIEFLPRLCSVFCHLSLNRVKQ